MEKITNFFGFPLEHDLDIDSTDLILASKEGLIGAITGFYIGDIVKNIFIDQKKNIFDIINIRSKVNDYMGAASAGFVGGITSLFLDPIANNIFSTSMTSYSANEYGKLMNEETVSDFELAMQIIFDVIATSIIFSFIYSGNIHVPVRHHKFYLNQNNLDNQNIVLANGVFSLEFTSQFLTAIFLNLYYLFREKMSN